MAQKPRSYNNTKTGYYKIKNPDKYMGNPIDIVYRSSWEYKFMVYCDLNDKILKWSSESIKIPYTDHTGKSRYYIPDFYIETKHEKVDGLINKFLIEVKPAKETKQPIMPKGTISEKKLKKLEYELKTWMKNKYKWVHAMEWCNARDIKFLIVTENHLKYFKL
jgi:hypothetical protein